MRPIGIDLFAGVGGMSLGFEQAGFDVAAAVEIDPIHAAVHRFNFPACNIIPKSVIGLDGFDIRGAAQLQGRSVDVVFGGAPCQGFSLIGQRSLEDPRNALVREFVRLVSELDARYFVFENVRGLTLGAQKRFLVELIEAFEAIGYSVRLPWRILNAAWFRVPQDRQRLFLIGAKAGFKLPEYPAAVTRPAGSDGASGLFTLPEGPCCEDALGDLPEVEMFRELLTADSVVTDHWGRPSPYAEELRCLSSGSSHFAYRRRWDSRLLSNSLRTRHTEISRRRFGNAGHGSVEEISRFFKLPRRGVSNTLRAGTDSARGAFTSPRPIHYERPRCVTVREMARLHGFPDWFRFHETKWHGARQIGNAVPPPLARYVASKIMEAGGWEPTLPDLVLDLGDAQLLRMGMSRAAAYWGVPRTIGGRDRKNGLRKRKQEDIEALRAGAY
jgi:DNA (cytosine-5)-methyltransferase 1